MSSAASVLVLALGLLGRSPSSLPPIVLIDVRPMEVSANAEGFARRNPDTIYLITSTPAFLDAQAGDTRALRKIASIIMHEEWHILHGSGERGAYERQLLTLWSLGIGPGTTLYTSVTRSMLAVLKAEKAERRRQPELQVAEGVPPRR